MIEPKVTCDIARCMLLCKGIFSFNGVSYVQTNATTPNTGRPTTLGVVASVLAVVCKRMQQLPTMFGPAVQRGKDPKLLRYASVIKEQKRWEILAKRFHRFKTLRNNMQQGVQTDATCSIHQC